MNDSSVHRPPERPTSEAKVLLPRGPVSAIYLFACLGGGVVSWWLGGVTGMLYGYDSIPFLGVFTMPLLGACLGGVTGVLSGVWWTRLVMKSVHHRLTEDGHVCAEAIFGKHLSHASLLGLFCAAIVHTVLLAVVIVSESDLGILLEARVTFLVGLLIGLIGGALLGLVLGIVTYVLITIAVELQRRAKP